jgi:hypothetical protein
MKKPELQPPLTVDVSAWKTAESIPTEEAIPFDYGREVNEKLKSLGWTGAQYDYFLDWMHQEKSIDDLVSLVLFYAPKEWIVSEADAIGTFNIEEEE